MTSVTAALLVCFGFRSPPVVSPAKDTLRTKGPIAPLALKATLSGVQALEVTRNTSYQEMLAPGRASPKPSERFPCGSGEAIGSNCEQSWDDQWTALEQPGLKLS
jgi:hypothetical protein